MPHQRSTNPRKLPQQDRSRITVEAILEATTHILIEEGYDTANTNHIAERAGISVGSLYQSERIAELLRAYLKHWSDLVQPQNLEMTVFM
jgi:AcrR family transcriptional regulator